MSMRLARVRKGSAIYHEAGVARARRGRFAAVVMAAFMCAGLLLPSLASMPASAATLPPAPMPLISRGVPAYASSSRGRPANAANDGDYATYWRSAGTPAWLAYDLSGVPVERRGNVDVAWYNDPLTPDYEHTLTRNRPYNLPFDYTVEANRAPGGPVPNAGWDVLATVAGNTLHSRQHALNLGGYNWVRINITKAQGDDINKDVALNMDVHDASRGLQDSWIFYGDYISAAGLDHNPRGIGTFGQLINGLHPDYFPAQESGGTSYVQSGDGARRIKDWVSVFPGQFVVLSFGTLDADFFDAGMADLPKNFYGNYEIMVKAVLDAGKTPVVPKVPWGRTNKIQVNGPRLNAELDKLYAAYPQIIKGPDFWAWFAGHQDEISADNLNPTSAGYVEYRRLWASEMSTKVYGAGSVQPTPPPAPGPCTGRVFPETGKCVNEPFLSYWNAHGQLAINGYPISDAFTETLEDGKQYTVQYFERVRMELHPENQPPYNILLGQFGRRIHPADPAVAAKPGARFFPETGHNLAGSFLAYWTANGGLPQFGYPISEEFVETLEDGKQYSVQYFERARFEHHPENKPPYDVLLGQFGRRILGNR